MVRWLQPGSAVLPDRGLLHLESTGLRCGGSCPTAGQQSVLHQGGRILPDRVTVHQVLFSASVRQLVVYKCMAQQGCMCRWLRPGGAILPDRVTVHLAGASEAALDLQYWDQVYGFSMRPVRSAATSTVTPCIKLPAMLQRDMFWGLCMHHSAQ